jgi:peptide/nickel transport system substrate-binding protein
MRRRSMLQAAAILPATGLAGPAIGQNMRARTLRFVPQANLTSLDPIWTTAAVTENHGWTVFDTLFGLTDDLRTQPQMAEATASPTTAAAG